MSGDMRAQVERAREALNETPWWRIFKRIDAGRRFRYALLAAALSEFDEVQP